MKVPKYIFLISATTTLFFAQLSLAQIPETLSYQAVMSQPADLQPPELLAPANNYLSYDGRPTFQCGTSQGATLYQFCISEKSYTGPCETNTRSLRFIPGSRGTQFRLNAPLPFRGVLAKWHVHAMTALNVGQASPDRSLRLALPSAELTLPNNNASVGNRPEFRWQKVSGANRYKIVITNSKRQKKEYVLSSRKPGFKTRSFTPSAADPIPFSGRVRWSVNAYNSIVPYYSKPVGTQTRKMTLPRKRGGRAPEQQTSK